MAKEKTPARLLARAAAALNAVEDATGGPVRLRHDTVFTPAGYVLRLAGGRWAARTLDYTTFPTPASGDDD